MATHLAGRVRAGTYLLVAAALAAGTCVAIQQVG